MPPNIDWTIIARVISQFTHEFDSTANPMRMQKGADLSYVLVNYGEILLAVIEKKDIKTAKSLLQLLLQPECSQFKWENKTQCFNTAIKNGLVELIPFFIQTLIQGATTPAELAYSKSAIQEGLQEAIKSKNWAALKAIVNAIKAANPADKYPDYAGAVYTAILYKQTEMALFLLGNSFTLNPEDEENLGHLWKAIDTKQLKLIQPLVHAGANLSTKTTERKPMYLALKHRDWEAVKALASAKKASSAQESEDWYYTAALSSAIASYKTDVALLLLKQGARPSQITNELNNAISNEQYELIAPLVAAGADFYLKNSTVSHMLLAAEKSDWKAVAALAQTKKVNMDVENDRYNFRETLRLAIEAKQTNIALLLLQQGAPVYSYDYISNAVATHQDVLVKPLFASMNACLNGNKPSGCHPLLDAAQRKDWHAVKVIAKLIKANTANESDEWGYDYALSVALAHHKIDEARLLLKQGARITNQNQNFSGKHCITHLVDANQLDLLIPLIAAGATLSGGYDDRGYPRCQPIYSAALNNKWKAVRTIAHIKKANNPEENIDWGYDEALDQAVEKKQTDLALFLLQQGARPIDKSYKINNLFLAVKTHQYDLIQPLIRAGATPMLGGFFAKSPIEHALKHNDWKAIELIVSAKKATNAFESRTWQYNDALLAAIKAKKTDIALLLLEQGAKPNEPDYLYAAIQTGQYNLLEPLLKADAELAAFSLEKTPLYLAIKKEKWDVAKKLISHKKVNYRQESDSHGYTYALHQAMLADQTKIVALLLDQGAIADKNVYLEIIETNSLELLKFLINEGKQLEKIKSIHGLRKHGKNLIYDIIAIAMAKNNWEVIKVIIKNFPAKDENEKTFYGYDLLFEKAFKAKQWDIVKILLEQKPILKDKELEDYCTAVQNDAFDLFLKKPNLTNRDEEKANFRNRDENISKALTLLDDISSMKFSKKANATLAEHIYNFAIQAGYTFTGALELAKPYFEEHIEGPNHTDDKEIYYHAMCTALVENDVQINNSKVAFKNDSQYDFGLIKILYAKMLTKNPPLKKASTIDKEKFLPLIEKYKLHDIAYWQTQIRFGGGREIVVDGATVKVPHVIANLRELLFSDSTAKHLWKLNVINIENSNDKNMLSRFATFFSRTAKTSQLHQEIDKILHEKSDKTSPSPARGH